MTIANLIFPAMLLTASAAGGNDRLPQPGSFGFNWLDATSRCKKLTKQDLAPVSKCSISTDAFGLDLKAHACKVNSRVELIVYKTASQCQEAWETMQANAP